MPGDIRNWLADRARSQHLTQAELFIAAQTQHEEQVRADYAGRRRRRRRHTVEGRTDIGLYLSGAEIDSLDDLAAELGIGRSELVTELLGHARTGSLASP